MNDQSHERAMRDTNQRWNRHRRLFRAAAWLFLIGLFGSVGYARMTGSRLVPAFMSFAGAALMLWNAVLELWSGSTLGWRGKRRLRSDQPADFWFDVAVQVVAAMLLAYAGRAALRNMH